MGLSQGGSSRHGMHVPHGLPPGTTLEQERAQLRRAAWMEVATHTADSDFHLVFLSCSYTISNFLNFLTLVVLFSFFRLILSLSLNFPYVF